MVNHEKTRMMFILQDNTKASQYKFIVYSTVAPSLIPVKRRESSYWGASYSEIISLIDLHKNRYKTSFS